MQSFGSLAIADRTEVLEGDLEDEAIVGYYRGDDLVGALLLGLPRQMVRVRKLVMAALAEGRDGHRAAEGAA